MFDVQLQIIGTGALVWAQSFSNEQQAQQFLEQLQHGLETLELAAFRTKYNVPASS